MRGSLRLTVWSPGKHHVAAQGMSGYAGMVAALKLLWEALQEPYPSVF